MSFVSVPSTDYIRSVDRCAIKCPFCGAKMNPDYLFLHGEHIFALCSNSGCGKYMILSKDFTGSFSCVEPNSLPEKKNFSEFIMDVSSEFVNIYNQAYCAEQLSLDQVCGVGYRKALEFLIKDYLISREKDAAKVESIKKKFINNCIQDDVTDGRIKEVAKRAVWLGNDETHYVRKWVDKDVSDLKHLIDLTIRWIENEIETDALLESMPGPIK